MMLEQKFATMTQQSVFEKVSKWMSEIYGEQASASSESPHIFLNAGSALVSVAVFPWGDNEAMISARSWVVTDARITPDLMHFLLRENSDLLFGAFELTDDGSILLSHVLLGSTCDKDELRMAVGSVAFSADDYDDKIVLKWGGKRWLER